MRLLVLDSGVFDLFLSIVLNEPQETFIYDLTADYFLDQTIVKFFSFYEFLQLLESILLGGRIRFLFEPANKYFNNVFDNILLVPPLGLRILAVVLAEYPNFLNASRAIFFFFINFLLRIASFWHGLDRVSSYFELVFNSDNFILVQDLRDFVQSLSLLIA